MTSARMRINDPSNNKLDSHYNMVAKNTSHKLCNATTTRLLKIDNRKILLTDTWIHQQASGFRHIYMNSNTTFYTGTIRYIASPMPAAHTRIDDDD